MSQKSRLCSNKECLRQEYLHLSGILESAVNGDLEDTILNIFKK